MNVSSQTCAINASATGAATVPSLHNTTIPWAIKDIAQWLIAGEDKKPHSATKPPNEDISRGDDATNPKNWSSFHVAQDAALTRGAGWRPGLCLTRETKITLIDLDKSVSASGTLTPEAAAIVARFEDAAYIEKSCSGKGIHILVRGTLPKPPARRKLDNIECYDAGRFVVFTGDTLSSTPLVKDFTRELARFHAEYFPPPSKPLATFTTPGPAIAIADEELLQRCLRSERFRALYERGDVGPYGGDDSSADLAFINIVRQNGGQPSQADALYRRSAIARQKWDKRRGERGTYGAITLAKGFDGTIAPSPLKLQVGTLAPAATGDAVLTQSATNWEARALLAERQLAECGARLRESERRLALLSQVQSRTSGILRNTALRGSCRTAIAVTNRLANWEASGDTGDSRGFHPLRIAGPDGLAEASGASTTTVSKHLGQLEQGGFISREVRTILEATDAETGEIIPMHRLTFVAARYESTLDMIDALAKHTPARAHKDGTADKGWGGNRPKCPLHRDAGTVKKWTLHCAACDLLLEAGTEAIAPTLQVGTLASEELAPKAQHDTLASEAEPTLTSHVLGDTGESVVNVLIPSKTATYHNEEPVTAEPVPFTRPVGARVWLAP